MGLRDYLLFIFLGVIGAIITFLIIKKDEYFILVGIFIGVFFIFGVIELILDKFFQKNKISKILKRIMEWIKDNIIIP